MIAPGLRVSAGTVCQRWDCVSLSELSSVAVEAFSLRALFFKSFCLLVDQFDSNYHRLEAHLLLFSFGITNTFRSLSEKIA